MRKQQLITKQIEKALLKSPFYSKENESDPKVICKFFNPYGIGSWYVLEGDKQADAPQPSKHSKAAVPNNRLPSNNQP